MTSINIKGCKKCAFCKYWYDPTNASINPKSPQVNVWEYDERAMRMCLKSGMKVSAGSSCGKFVGKLDIM